MPPLDWPTILNRAVDAAVAFAFAVLGTLVTYRLEAGRERKKRAEEEKERIRKQLTAGVDDLAGAIQRQRKGNIIIKLPPGAAIKPAFAVGRSRVGVRAASLRPKAKASLTKKIR